MLTPRIASLQRCFSAALLVACSDVAAAQDFNVDLGHGAAFQNPIGGSTIYVGAPAANYGAAGLVGHWVQHGVVGTTIQLSDVNGAAPGVTLRVNAGTWWGGGGLWNAGAPLGTNLNLVGLLGDALDPLGGATIRVEHLAPGRYEVLTYCVEPDANGSSTDIAVVGASEPTQNILDLGWPGSYTAGVTHTVHHVTIVANAPLDILVTAPLPGWPGNVNGFQLRKLPASSGTPFCFGDGSFADHTTACPCANSGAPGHGCAHSFDPNGAELAASGDVSSNSVVLAAHNEPASSFTLFLQHSTSGDTAFHDGVLCAGGTLVRLRGRPAAGGDASFPNAAFAEDATTTLSQRGGVAPGQGVRRYYSAWYRNASTTFCPPATANVTNGWIVDW